MLNKIVKWYKKPKDINVKRNPFLNEYWYIDGDKILTVNENLVLSSPYLDILEELCDTHNVEIDNQKIQGNLTTL